LQILVPYCDSLRKRKGTLRVT